MDLGKLDQASRADVVSRVEPLGAVQSLGSTNSTSRQRLVGCCRLSRVRLFYRPSTRHLHRCTVVGLPVDHANVGTSGPLRNSDSAGGASGLRSGNHSSDSKVRCPLQQASAMNSTLALGSISRFVTVLAATDKQIDQAPSLLGAIGVSLTLP